MAWLLTEKRQNQAASPERWGICRSPLSGKAWRAEDSPRCDSALEST